MKKLIALVLASLMVLGLFAACGNNVTTPTTTADATGEATGSTIKTIKDGVLKVALSPDFAPMEFVDLTKEGQDQYVGFDVSLSKYIAEQFGLELEIMPMSFDACQTAVSLGKVDLGVSGFSWTEDRAENYNISDWYQAGENETEQVLITLAANGDKYKDAANVEGLKVGAQTASLQESLCAEQLPDAELVVYSDITTGIMQLKKGDFDVMAVADGNADALIANNPDIAKTGFEFVVDEKYTDNVILIQKGNDAMLDAVNAVLAQAKAAGLYETWYNEALETAGVDVSYDDDGNVITDDADATDATDTTDATDAA